jgi:hypothetical protein
VANKSNAYQEAWRRARTLEDLGELTAGWAEGTVKVDGEMCGRRVGKLYRPPESRHFVCRRCLDLTYEG